MTRFAVLAALLVSLVACGGEARPPVVALDVDVTPARSGVPMRAAYLTIANRGETAIRIDAASSPEFGRVELHETVVENDVARMRKVEQLDIAPGDEVRLERGGLHLMLMQPVDTPNQDGRVTLNFYDGDRLVLSVTANGT